VGVQWCDAASGWGYLLCRAGFEGWAEADGEGLSGVRAISHFLLHSVWVLIAYCLDLEVSLRRTFIFTPAMWFAGWLELYLHDIVS